MIYRSPAVPPLRVICGTITVVLLCAMWFLAADSPHWPQQWARPQVPVAKASDAAGKTCVGDSGRFVFIDLGANRADTLSVFLQDPAAKFHYAFPKPDECAYTDAHIYLFEANPTFNSDLVLAKSKWARHSPSVRIEIFPSTIVWLQDGTKKLYLDLVNPDHDFWGSSIFANSGDVQRSGSVHVNLTTIDIAKWILVNFVPEDYVVVKMDIEGAEHYVVPHMLAMGAHMNIDQFLIEWHAPAPEDVGAEVGRAAVQRMKELGVQLPEYDSAA
ncbi:hypothetical protein HDU89_003704 [Geranomyces variabilis]|nr:hypothetical protein HDU89_003704 [Geranomyces variabilis]